MNANWIARIRKGMLGVVVALSCLVVAPQQAQASWVMDRTMEVLDLVHNNYDPSIPSGNDVKGVFNCLEGNTPTLECIETYGGDYGATINMVVDLYYAVDDGNVMAVVGIVGKWLGDDALCIVADIVAPGVGGNLCALAQELIAAGKAVLAFGGAVLEFFGDLGEGIYCAFADCGPDTPPEVFAFAVVFEPRIPAGLQAIKEGDEDFDNLRANLVAHGKDSVPAMIAPVLTPQAMAIAAVWFTDAVERAWTGHVIQVVAPAVSKKENEFAVQHSNAAGLIGAGAYVQSKIDPRKQIEQFCKSHFHGNPDVAQLDRWSRRKMVASDSNTATMQVELARLAPSQWCNWVTPGSLWATYKLSRFAPAFQQYLGEHNICAAAAQGKVRCSTLGNYRSCLGLMRHVRDDKAWLDGACDVDMAKVGQEVAADFNQHFKNWGSTRPCAAVPVSSAKPVDFRCGRPTQRLVCIAKYPTVYADLPRTLLSCTLAEPPDYVALRNKASAGASAINAALREHEKQADLTPGTLTDFLTMPEQNGDPLILGSDSTEAFEIAKQYNTIHGLGFQTIKPCSENQPPIKYTIDGVSTPVICFLPPNWGKIMGDMENKVKPGVDKLGAIKDRINPGNPIGPDVLVADKLSKTQLLGRDQIQAPGMVGMQAPGMVRMQAPGIIGLQAPGMVGAQAPQQPMMGSLPPGSGLPSEPTISLMGGAGKIHPAGNAMSSIATMPDLMVTGMPRIGGIPVNWGGTLMLDANRATLKKASGLCEFPLEFAVRNGGQAESGGFRTLWANAAAGGFGSPRNWQSLPPGTERAEREVVALRPGLNALRLALDDMRQVNESNEANNEATININLSGSCAPSRTGVEPMRNGVMPAPALRPLPNLLQR